MLNTVPKRLKLRLKKISIVLIGLYLMIGTALYFFQEKILFLPTRLEQNYEYQFAYPFEELFLKPDDETVLNALHFKVENPKGVIVYFHGNAGNLVRWGEVATYFVEKQYDVFILDYRTYGKSTGSLSEAAFYKDAEFCYDYVLNQYPENKITLYGRSLGTGIASYLASKHKPKQLILETPYYSILDVAEYRFPMFPVKRLLKYRFPTFEFLPKVKCPITSIHGTADKIVPYPSGEKLAKLNLDNFNFITVENGHHNDLIDFDEYHKVIEAILK